MNTLLLAYLFAFSANANADAWRHQSQGPELLTDAIVQKTYPDERRPFRHSGITVTDYLGDFAVTYPEAKPGCFRPQIQQWVVKSTMYVRPKKVEGPDGKAVSNPRWQELTQHQCRESDADFNTWEGTAYHESQHLAARDQLLKGFWKELRAALPEHCSESAEEAKGFLEKILESFLIEVHQADSEDRAEKLEAAWYRGELKRKLHVTCLADLGFLPTAFPKAKIERKENVITVRTSSDAFTGLQKGNLTLLKSKASEAQYYFQYGSLMAKEFREGELKLRDEYYVSGKFKHRVWLDPAGKITAKAWADQNGKLGSKVTLVSSALNSPEAPLLTILDTGLEDSDEDGHGTFVVSVARDAGKLSDQELLSLKVSSNLDESLWKGLTEAKGKIINLSIGQGITSARPPSKEAITKTCAQLKALSQNKLIVMGAGNDGSLLEKSPFYPAACAWEDSDNVLVVGSYDRVNHINATFGRQASNWSPTQVHGLVSGALFVGNYPGGAQALLGGTSFAAAYVSGKAAKLARANPTLSTAQLKALVLKDCALDSKAAAFARGGCVWVRGR